MSRFIDYQPMHEDSIDYSKCKWLYNEVCCNDSSPYVADYPYPLCKCESKLECEFFEEEVEE